MYLSLYGVLWLGIHEIPFIIYKRKEWRLNRTVHDLGEVNAKNSWRRMIQISTNTPCHCFPSFCCLSTEIILRKTPRSKTKYKTDDKNLDKIPLVIVFRLFAAFKSRFHWEKHLEAKQNTKQKNSCFEFSIKMLLKQINCLVISSNYTFSKNIKLFICRFVYCYSLLEPVNVVSEFS